MGVGQLAIWDGVGVGNVAAGEAVGWLAGESPEELVGVRLGRLPEVSAGEWSLHGPQ